MTWRYFTLSEFACKGTDCCGHKSDMDPAFIDLLDELRHRCGFPFRITSGYRCPIHNTRVSSTGLAGPHTTGQATDIGVDRGQAVIVLREALQMPFKGFGVNQKGGGRFLHLDTCRASPTVWSYP